MSIAQSTSNWIGANRTEIQVNTYNDFYSRWTGFRWAFRFDVRYRCRRLIETAQALNIDLEHKKVLDAGFGAGQMLSMFPKSCDIHGAEISSSAVALAKSDEKYMHWKSATFTLISEEDTEDLPPGPFDIIVSSHVLEHVRDDRKLLSTIYGRLKPGGIIYLFVPIEEPNYNPDHVRNYSLDTIRALVIARKPQPQQPELFLHPENNSAILLKTKKSRCTQGVSNLLDRTFRSRYSAGEES